MLYNLFTILNPLCMYFKFYSHLQLNKLINIDTNKIMMCEFESLSYLGTPLTYLLSFFSGEKPFSCPHCSRAFADRSNLRAHLQTHSDIKKYQCRSCSKTFSRISLLSKHEEAGCCPMSWLCALRSALNESHGFSQRLLNCRPIGVDWTTLEDTGKEQSVCEIQEVHTSHVRTCCWGTVAF